MSRNPSKISRKVRKGLVWKIIVIAVVVPLSVSFVSIYLQSRGEPIAKILTKKSLLDNSQVLYDGGRTGFVGNDSYLRSIRRVSENTAKQILDLSPAIKVCLKDSEECTTSPTWRPRSNLARNTGHQLAYIEDESTKSLYRSITDEASTMCTARNRTANESVPEYFNVDLLCVNTNLGLVSLEYVSDDSSMPF